MKIYAVLQGYNVCFCELHRFRVASYILPDDNPIESIQWQQLAITIGELEVGEYIEYGDYTVVLEEIDDDKFRELHDSSLDQTVYQQEECQC